MRKAIELDTYFAEAYHNLGVILTGLKEYEEAESLLRKANQISPENADILFSLGEILRLRCKDDEAIPAYRKAIELNPRYKMGAFAPVRYYEEFREW